MLEEAVSLIRKLHEAGSAGTEVTHHGEFYTVENARIYSAPPEPVPIYISAFGPKAVELAGRIGDGFICTMPDASLRKQFLAAGSPDRPTQGGFKVCWASSEQAGAETAHRYWPNMGLPGELAQVLPTPRHFEQASGLVGVDTMRSSLPCGPDPGAHIAAVREFVDAGYDEVYVQQIGPEQDAFFQAWAEHVLPVITPG
jgi:G6PDH family F420-dependent oxidoreductase